MIQKKMYALLFSLLSITSILDARPRRESKINLQKYKASLTAQPVEHKQAASKQRDKQIARSSSSSDSETDCVVCGKVTPIFSVPFTITESGKYCLTKNVTYSGSSAAIVIAANNVSLDLANHSITLTSPSTGISIANVNEVAISNDALTFQSNTNAVGGLGIHVINSQKITLDNNLLSLFEVGLLIENSVEVAVNDSAFNECELGSFAITCTDVRHINTTFDDCQEGLTFDQNCQDILIDNVVETNSSFGSYIRWAHGVIIQNSIFECTNARNPFSLLQIGSTDDPQAHVFDIIIQNCQFINRVPVRATDAGAGFEGVLFAAGSNAVVDSCVIDINSSPTPGNQQIGELPYINGALHFSQTLPVSLPPSPSAQNQFFSNARVTNCVLSNLAGNAVTTENFTQDLTLERNIINSFLIGVYLQGTSATVVRYNDIQHNGANGVEISASNLLLPAVASTSNTIEYNVIANNGISGVELDSISENNLVHDNQVFSNGLRGINNNGIQNRIFYNTAFDNGTGTVDNYVGADVINAPGNPAVCGENLSA